MALDYQTSTPIILGSGELYVGTVDNVETATEIEIEAALENVGAIESGATVTYSPNITSVESANRGVIANFITKETVTFSTGIMTWIIDNLAILSPATVTTDALTGKKSIKIGGKNKLPVNYIRFIHTKDDGGELIVNIAKAQALNGFALTFDKENPVTTNYEFSALSRTDGTLVEIIETFVV